MNNLTILDATTVLEGHAFDVKKLHCRLPDGRLRYYDLVDHTDAVTIMPVNEEGEVIFVSQYRIGAERILLELPAGVMDKGEDSATAVRRELREEIGMDCRTLLPLGGFYMAAGYSNEYMNVYLAMDLFPAALDRDDDEFLELSSHPLIQVYSKVWTGEIQDGKTLATLLMALPDLLQKFPGLVEVF